MMAVDPSDAQGWVEAFKGLAVVGGSIGGVILLARTILTGQSILDDRQADLLAEYRNEVVELRRETARLEAEVAGVRGAVEECRGRERRLVAAIEALGGQVPL